MNYEGELSLLLLDGLKKLYNIEDEILVYHYFYLRFLIRHKDTRIDRWNIAKLIINFILNELNLPIENDKLCYKDVYFCKMFCNENSLDNIWTDWHFRGSLHKVKDSQGKEVTFEQYIDTQYKKILTYGRNKAKPYKKTPYYDDYFLLHSLELLNKLYCTNISQPPIISHINYPLNHNYCERTLEEKCRATIHHVEFITNNTATITELELEKYLIKHLDVLEEGLRYIQRQYIIKDGRIDILAKDKANNYVIIELKVVEDKELVYQSIYYPLQFKHEYRTENVRMMVVTPKLSEHLLLALKQVEEVEIFEFSALIELGRIKDIVINKVLTK